MTITLTQAKNLRHGTILYHKINRNADGTPQRWRVNGTPKTWKRDPSRVEVPLKFGLYKHDRLTENELHLVSLTEKGAENPVPKKSPEPTSKTPKTALQYVRKVADVISKSGVYGTMYRGKEGAKRFAREMGYGFNDFPRSQHAGAITASYNEICVPMYGKGTISKKEWVDEIKSQISKYGGQR
jgi:hypothetical protein